MARRNRTNRRPQRIKHNVEDRIARRAVARAVEESYRAEGGYTIYPDGHKVITFTDPSFAL